jgi:hypothetical protein
LSEAFFLIKITTIFRESSGEQSTAQIHSFTDFWQWDIKAE